MCGPDSSTPPVNYYAKTDQSGCDICRNVISHCITCTSSVVTKCTQCDLGFVTSSTGLSCVPCSDPSLTPVLTNCDRCTRTGSSTVTCQRCSIGYPKFDNSGCDSCSNLISFCSTCAVADGTTPSGFSVGYTYCASCNAGNFPKSPAYRSCAPCSNATFSNCQTCSAVSLPVTCSACKSTTFAVINVGGAIT